MFLLHQRNNKEAALTDTCESAENDVYSQPVNAIFLPP